jgi:signal transduction histidine kinase
MKLATQISLGFLIAISVDLVDSFVNYTLTLKVKKDSEFLNRSESVIRGSGSLNKGIIDMQSAFRGYLLTDDERFLAPYYNGAKVLPGLLQQELSLVTLPAQRHLLDSISTLHNRWVDYAGELIAAKGKAVADRSAAAHFTYLFETRLKREVGKGYNDKIAELFRSFDQIEYEVREQRRKALSDSIDQTDRYSLVFSVLLVMVGTSGAIYLVRKISRRIRSQVKLAEKISRGNFGAVYDDKRDELSSLSVSLNAMSNKLSQNISALEKRNAELNQFAYVVSHDLKAPVRGISNVVRWIEEDLAGEISPEMRKYLDIIPERIMRMENLIDGLLEYARIGRDTSFKEQVDVSLLIKDIVESIVPKGYRLSIGPLPIFFTEKLLLQQVFGNLISNAVKYTPVDGGEIVISSVEQDGFYEFCVTDNGPGIDHKYHEKIFVIFQTLREKHDKESTGIGLAIVKKIVEEMQGRIRVVSSPGSGTSFIFTWPKDRT